MDAAQFDRWYAASFARLVTQLALMTGDRAEAQDCVQQAFVRAWQRRDHLAEVGRDAWVRQTAYRLAVSRWRRLRRGRELAERTWSPATLAGPDPARVAVLEAVARLPIEQRRVVVLHYFADRSIAQIAAELARPEGTVKAQLHRARASLAALLAPDTTPGGVR